MFNHIAGKCKGLAKLIFWLGLIGSLIAGIVLIVEGGSVYYHKETYYGIAAVTILFGPLLSWIAAIPVYCIGEAAENGAIAANFLIKADRERGSAADGAAPDPRQIAGAVAEALKKELVGLVPDPRQTAGAIADILKRELTGIVPDPRQTAEEIAGYLKTEMADTLHAVDMKPDILSEEAPAADPTPERKPLVLTKEALAAPEDAAKPLFPSLNTGTSAGETGAAEPAPAFTAAKAYQPSPAAPAEPVQPVPQVPAAPEPPAAPVSLYEPPVQNSVRCPECGKTISAKAPFCPNCGTPVAAQKIPVHFERKKAFSGSANTGTVIIDGLTVGSAGNGASFDVMLSAGSHNVVIESRTQGVLGADRTYSTTLEIPGNAKKVNVTMAVKTDTASFLSGGMAIRIVDVQVVR